MTLPNKAVAKTMATITPITMAKWMLILKKITNKGTTNMATTITRQPMTKSLWPNFLISLVILSGLQTKGPALLMVNNDCKMSLRDFAFAIKYFK
jgi:hypothetical protein